MKSANPPTPYILANAGITRSFFKPALGLDRHMAFDLKSGCAIGAKICGTTGASVS